MTEIIAFNNSWQFVGMCGDQPEYTEKGIIVVNADWIKRVYRSFDGPTIVEMTDGSDFMTEDTPEGFCEVLLG